MPPFARDEAEALLPKVRAYLEDIQRRKQSFDRRPTQPVAAEIRALVRTINELGVEVKDLDAGLIDFPTVRRGKPIYLCWKLGEGDSIEWWHDSLAGSISSRTIRSWSPPPSHSPPTAAEPFRLRRSTMGRCTPAAR